jgi:hypothetical protein
MAYSMHYRPGAVIAAEANPLVRELLLWMRNTCASSDLAKLDALRVKTNVHVNTVGLSRVESTLMRLQTSGSYVGQLSSSILYAQHSTNMAQMADDVEYLKNALIDVYDDFSQTLDHDMSGSMFFIDPPYAGTQGNYKSKGRDFTGVNAGAIQDFVLALRCPVLFTYGDGAQTVFPALMWEKVCDRKVPILRGGGTRDRTEWICRRNWT